MDLDFDLRPLRSDAALLLPRLLDEFRPDAPPDELLRTGEEIVLWLHILAAGALLVEGNSQKFFLHLSRCAENGLRLLKVVSHRRLDRPPASRNVPLLAALATGDFARAAEIARLSRDSRDLPSGEYEDEFLWARALQLLALDADATVLAPVLDRLDQLDPAAYGDSTAAARALLARDRKAFSKAITAGALAYEIATEKRAAAFGTPVTTFAPHRFLWLEGLALLRLGERAGLEVDRELRFCPRLARVPMTVRYEGDLAVGIGAAAG